MQLIEFYTKGDKGVTGLDHIKTSAGRNTDFFFFFFPMTVTWHGFQMLSCYPFQVVVAAEMGPA